MSITAKTAIEKAGDAVVAFEVLRDAVTPAPFRGLINAMTNVPSPEESSPEQFAAYASLVQGSMTLARIVAANDRAALIAAAILTQNGVVKAAVLEEEE